MTEPRLPVLTPVSPPAPARALRLPLVVSAVLATCVAGASAVVFLGPGTPPKPPAVPPRPAGPRFGAENLPRVEALRDVLVERLLARRGGDGLWTPEVPRLEEVHRTEATALALAGLAAARWMGSKDPRLADAIEGAKAALRARQEPDGSFGALTRAATRDSTYSALASGIVALALAGDPADGPALDRAGAALRRQWDLGPPTDFFTRGIAIQAILALTGTGHRASLGEGGIIDRAERRGTPDTRDHYVVEAFARTVRGEDPAGFTSAVVDAVVATGADWGGERTDVSSWLLRAWLCSRVPGGQAWFPKALAGLEEAVRPGGGLETAFYGDPVSRLSCALLILVEGFTARLPFGA